MAKSNIFGSVGIFNLFKAFTIKRLNYTILNVMISSIKKVSKTKTSTDLEPQKPTLNLPYGSIDHISPKPSD
jgi:hypothetical protein